MTGISRRSVLAASAWAVPVIAIAAHTPGVAASTDMSGYALTLSAELISSNFPIYADVTIPERAIPIPADSTTVTFVRLSGTGMLTGNWSTSAGWVLTGSTWTEMVFTAPAEPASNPSQVGISVSGESDWLVTLDTPHGTLTQTFSVLPPL